jgi:hypothetical protein
MVVAFALDPVVRSNGRVSGTVFTITVPPRRIRTRFPTTILIDAPGWWPCVGRGSFRAWPRNALSDWDINRVCKMSSMDPCLRWDDDLRRDDVQQHRRSSKPAFIRFRLRLNGPGAEGSAPYARPPIRRVVERRRIPFQSGAWITSSGRSRRVARFTPSPASETTTRPSPHASPSHRTS